MIKKNILVVLILLLSGCSVGNSNIKPNFDKSDSSKTTENKLAEINNKSELGIKKEQGFENNTNIAKEIADREKGFKTLNDQKAYLQSINTELESLLKDFNSYIDVTRQLMVVDLKMIDSIQKGLLEESAINNNNYFYAMIKSMNSQDRLLIMKDIENLISIISNKKDFNNYYFINFDLDKTDGLDEYSKSIYQYTNYYLQNAKYKTELSKTLGSIFTDLKILKIDRIEIYGGNSNFKGLSKVNLFETTLKNLQNKLLNK